MYLSFNIMYYSIILRQHNYKIMELNFSCIDIFANFNTLVLWNYSLRLRCRVIKVKG